MMVYRGRWLLLARFKAGLLCPHGEVTMRGLLMMTAVFIVGCCPPGHNNSKPLYGDETGLPKNCRAIVQANIDSYRSREYTADEVMASLERNCGVNGYSWDQ